ncbi:uncharacterized protein METZ01_LOCUS509472, partial [marine metagenome]
APYGNAYIPEFRTSQLTSQILA